MKHLPLRQCGYVLGFVILGLLLYGGAYLAMMERVETSLNDDADPRRTVVRYCCGNEWSERLFGPAHEIDRRMRPHLWENEIEPQAYRRFRAIVDAIAK